MFGLLLSGLAMQMMGNSRPASGAEHHISHIIEMQPEALGISSDALHGEKVGVGTLMVMRKYQQLAADPKVEFYDYVPCSAEKTEAVFGKEMSGELVRENQNDAAAGIRAEHLRMHFGQIVSEIEKLPDIADLEGIYKKARIRSCLEDIGVSNEKEASLLRYAPMVRNRLTLLRLLSAETIV